MNGEAQSKTEPPALNVTPGIVAAGRALVHRAHDFQCVNKPTLHRGSMARLEAERKATEALNDFKQIVAAENPHLDYAKIPMNNTGEFSKLRHQMRVDAVEPLNALVMQIAQDAGYENPERFAVFSKSNPRFQI